MELLESRTVMTALPFGAMPDDTGEFMLGDVYVTVVLMESNNAIDNGTIEYSATSNPQRPPTETISYRPEDWTQSAKDLVKQNILDGLEWWKETLDELPTVRDGLLNFTFDWTRWVNPVATPYEPIARRSDDVERSDVGWIYSFLEPALAQAGMSRSSSVSADIRKFNNYQRQQNDADWAFTIIVVNNANDLEDDLNDPSIPAKDKGGFAMTGPFRNAFSFAGGRYMVVPASRPASTYAHETGHMFWALDEYQHGGSFNSSRGYYNTPNSNAWDNPSGVQQPSIMANDDLESVPPTFLLSQAFETHVTSQSSAEMIGWRDTDGDGIFDVLDVPFELSGTGRFDGSAGAYLFTGSTSVRTLPNLNPAFLQNDITINRIREVQYAVDGGPWQVAQSFPERTYKTSLDLSIVDSLLASPGSHTIKIRTIDTRTGAMSPEFVGTVGPASTPQSVPSSQAGAAGFVYFDSDGNGSWDRGEAPLVDWGIEFVDPFDAPITLQKRVEPDDYVLGDVLNGVHPEATLSAVGSDTFRNEIQRLSFLFPFVEGAIPPGTTVTPAFDGVLGTPLAPVSPAVFLTASQVAASLNSIPELAGRIQVSGFGGIFQVTFAGDFAGTDVSLITQGAASGGATLTASTDVQPQSEGDVYALTIAPGAQKPLGFGNYSIQEQALTTTWTTSRQFRADFSFPVTRVSLKAVFQAGSDGVNFSVGRLEAYNSAGQLLERYTTKVLTGGSEIMTVAVPTADIAYVVAYGHLGSEVGLDTLVWGPVSSATTNVLGAWSITNLLTGTYRVKVIPPAGHIVTTPQSGQYTVSYIAGQQAGDLNFGIYNTDNIWHNIAKPENVNADSQFIVNTIDLLVLINWLTVNGLGAPLPTTGSPTSVGYLDVNNDKICTTMDILVVLNYLTMNPPGGGGGGGQGASGESGASGLTGGSGGGGSGGEGESPTIGGAELGSLTLSPEYLDSREDVHVHTDADDHDHGEHDLLDGLFAGNSLSGAASSGLSRNLTADLRQIDWLQQDRFAGPEDMTLDSPFESELDAALSAGQRLFLQPVTEDNDRELITLARCKKWEQAIDELAAELPAALDAQVVRALPRVAR